MADPGGFCLELSMGQGKFCAEFNRLEIEFKTRDVAGFVGVPARGPLPGHDETAVLHNLEIFAGALVLSSIEHAEPHPEPAADAHIRLGQQNRTTVRSPPAGDALRCCDCFEDNRRARSDAADEREACHRSFLLAAASLLSA